MFRMLGANAMLGRTFDDADANDPDVAILSFDAWRRHFGSDPEVVGTSIELHPGALMGSFSPRLLTVVGVLPAAFSFPTNTADYYVLLRSPPPGASPRVMMVAQLAEGASLESATDELNALGAASRGPWPVDAPALTATRFELERLQDIAVSEIRPQLGILLGSVVVVLLIVCANVANLLLARGTARHHEIALRLAIGASRGRLVRQMLTECLVLAAAGGALGALLAVAGVTLTKQLATVDAPGIFRLMFGTTILPRAHEVRVDMTTLGLALGLAAATSIVFGLLPALHLSRPRAVSLSGVRGTAGMARSRTRSVLVVSQLAMATILLVGAGLLIQSFVRLSGNNKGYDATNVVALQLLLPNEYSTARKAEVVDALLARLRQHPSVAAAGFARHGMLIGEALVLGPFVPRGRSLGDVEQGAVVRPRVRAVSDGFLTAMNVSFIEGRDFGPNSGENDARVLVINHSTAREWFGSERAVGQVVSWHAEGASVPATVIGVVDDVRQASLAQETFPEIYVEYHQLISQLERHPRAAQRQNELAFGFLSFAIQTTVAPESMLPEIRTTVGVADPHAGIDALLPMARLVEGSVARERFSAVLLSVFASISGVLAALGVYGLLAYVVVQRTAEIGIRMALGAGRASVLRLVLGDGLRLTILGVALGLLGAVALSRSLEAMLFDISPLDLATFVGVGILFGAVATLAAYVPARRATRVDPLVAMRAE
jgi:putative ABC transport system permease protein